MPQNELPILRVEGKDDRYVIEHLLSRHGIDWQIVEIKNSNDGDEDSGGKNLLLDGMRTLVTTSTGKAVGFVLDANGVASDRWRAVRDRLGDLGLALPDKIPEGGFVGDALKVKSPTPPTDLWSSVRPP